ncbi:hypothetical protein [Bacillus sp. MRMR6]|uniref:hypothetical protein n=1 Tax=Bacillus sp. MRMR6 TaxID=1928617 RepID=UPI0020C96CF8|nr:hypothetical protein [Bacillus sp. MRMR6]
MRNEIRREGHPRGEGSRGKDGSHRGERFNEKDDSHRGERFNEKDGSHRGEGSKGRGGSHHRGERSKGEHRGPKTFRRGRAIAFLEMMNLKRTTIKQQLEEPEFQSINQILIGELKMLDLMINEFTQLFEIHESEAAKLEPNDVEKENEPGLGAEGNEADETN